MLSKQRVDPCCIQNKYFYPVVTDSFDGLFENAWGKNEKIIFHYRMRQCEVCKIATTMQKNFDVIFRKGHFK